MSPAGILPFTSDASQTRVGGQTPDPMVALDSQTPRTHQVVVVAPLRGSARGPSSRVCIKMGFEQHEGKRDRHSGKFGSTPPRSRGSTRAFETDYARHSSSSLVQTSQGSSSKLIGCRGNSGHSGSSHQPTSYMGCFECGDMGHFVRDSPGTKSGGTHQGSQSLTFRVAQHPTRGGVQSGRVGYHSGRGGFHYVRGCGRGGLQYEGGHAHYYAFSGR
ncbi:hypothetical protein KY284_015609 [Solanum tuberosum]|nr:hypothetical protein KY284_015609 [Solanum tuberosum]